MIVWRLKPLLKRKGWENANQLATGAGLSYPVAHRLINEQMDRVDLGTLAKLCRALDCQPGDFLVYVPEKAGGKGRG